MKKQNKKGFTLTEVLVVVLVISVLAAIAYPMYMRSITKSKAVEAINLLEMVRNKQLQNFAKKGKYFTDFSGVNNLTSDAENEQNTTSVIKVKEYTLSLNTDKNCMYASYNKGNTKFTFSSSYETAGLGCSGDICKSFGDIVGTADDVCNCNTKCSNGFTLNTDSCACECNLGCNNGSSCTTPSQNQPLSQSCGNGGTQTRVCTASCGGGSCGAWGPCTGQTCASSLKPSSNQSCGKCGSQSRTISCNNSTGAWQTSAWGSCTGEGSCTPGATQSCEGNGTQTCTSSCSWGTCVTAAKTPCPSACSANQKRDTAVEYSEDGACCVAKTACPSTCPDGQERDSSVSFTEDGTCCVSKTCDANESSLCSSTDGVWNNDDCSCSCGGKKSWSAATGCQCTNAADSSVCANSGGTWDDTQCSCSCASNKVWSGTSCDCADTAAATKCTNSKGTWKTDTCACECSGKNMTLVNGECKPKFKAKKINIGVLVNCHYCPDGFSWRTVCGENNKEDCYYAGSFDVSQGCSPATSKRDAAQYVISYEFYQGGSLQKRKGGTNGGGDPEDAYLWWTGGTRIGGQMYRYSGGSMPNCGSDVQDFCNQRCDKNSSTCSAKCLVSKSVPGCVNPRYKYCWHKCSPTRYSASNAAGTGVVGTCQ